MRNLSEKTESLLTNLTDDEFIVRATELARSCQDVTTLEGKHADMKAQMKSELVAAETERNRLGQVVARKAELRTCGSN